MPSGEVFERQSFSNWYAESLRFTAFHPGIEVLPVRDWWPGMAGSDPEEETVKPRERRAIMTGHFGEGMLSLESQPFRVDLNFTPSPESQEIDGFSILGSSEETWGLLIEAVRALFAVDSIPSLQRIAFGSVLYLPVKDKETGYRQLQSYLHSVKLKPDNTEVVKPNETVPFVN